MFFSKRDGCNNRVTVPKKFADEAIHFTEKRKIDYFHYVKNREANYKQCSRQDWQAKVGEYALALFMTEKMKLPFVKPDMNYYPVRQKSYDADLKYYNVNLFGKHYKRLNLHCKSCDARTKDECGTDGYNGESYAFSFDLNGSTDTLFYSGDESDWIGCVFLPFEGIQKSAVEAYIRAIVPWNFVNDRDLWMPSKKDKFKDMKKFLYAERLLENLCL